MVGFEKTAGWMGNVFLLTAHSANSGQTISCLDTLHNWRFRHRISMCAGNAFSLTL